jgi:hypothetical protein
MPLRSSAIACWSQSSQQYHQRFRGVKFTPKRSPLLTAAGGVCVANNGYPTATAAADDNTDVAKKLRREIILFPLESDADRTLSLPRMNFVSAHRTRQAIIAAVDQRAFILQGQKWEGKQTQLETLGIQRINTVALGLQLHRCGR